nr:hypothetical protein [Tanacetum cinerariifolium]
MKEVAGQGGRRKEVAGRGSRRKKVTGHGARRKKVAGRGGRRKKMDGGDLSIETMPILWFLRISTLFYYGSLELG